MIMIMINYVYCHLCYPKPSEEQATAEAQCTEICLAILENVLYSLKLCLNTVFQLTVLFFILP